MNGRRKRIGLVPEIGRYSQQNKSALTEPRTKKLLLLECKYVRNSITRKEISKGSTQRLDMHLQETLSRHRCRE